MRDSSIARSFYSRYDLAVIDLRTTVAVFLLAFIAGGCASTMRMPQQQSGPHGSVVPVEPELTQGEKIVGIAATMLGRPYRYGGDSPKGFDCSGLVFYSYERLGIKVPRTAAEQRRAAEKVKKSSLEPGDLVFFRSSKGKVDHVGIYTGEGRFIHAPNAGKPVSYASLDDPYYVKHFVSAGRLL